VFWLSMTLTQPLHERSFPIVDSACPDLCCPACATAVGEHTLVVVLLVLGSVLVFLPEVSTVLADPVGDAPLLGRQRGAHHAVHGTPASHIQASTQPALVLLQQHKACVKQQLCSSWSACFKL